MKITFHWLRDARRLAYVEALEWWWLAMQTDNAPLTAHDSPTIVAQLERDKAFGRLSKSDQHASDRMTYGYVPMVERAGYLRRVWELPPKLDTARENIPRGGYR